MPTTDTKIDAIGKAINADIAEHEKEVADAILTLEQMNTSAEDYKKACRKLSIHNFIAGYLSHIRAIILTRDIKATESIIRFHAHYQHIKGNLDDGQDISIAQAKVAGILDGYAERFFDTEQ